MGHILSLSLRIFVALVFSVCFGLSELSSAEQPPDINAVETLKKPELSPKIQFDELVHDFGKVSQQETLVRTFGFKNAGTGILNIQDVKAG